MVTPYWYQGNWTNEFRNVGDIAPPYILKHLFGKDFQSCDKDDKSKLLSVGSVIEFLQDNDIVWGAGLIQPMAIEKRDNVTFISVRGTITRAALQDVGYNVPECYGDPCFMLPDIYFPDVEKQYDIGIVPHYVDEDMIREQNPDAFIISPMNTVEGFIDNILKCRAIISSSLHGIVISEAYGIPCKWAQYSNKIIGGHFKFHDYYQGTGRTPMLNEWMAIPDRNKYIHLTKFLETWNQKHNATFV